MKRFAWLGTAAAVCLGMPGVVEAKKSTVTPAATTPTGTTPTGTTPTGTTTTGTTTTGGTAGAGTTTAPVTTAPAVTAPAVAAVAATTNPKRIEPFRKKNISTFQNDVAPLYKNISTFWSGIDPQYKNISTFWGDLNPFYKNISTFSGVLPDYKNLGSFWNTNGSLWGQSMTIWSKVDAGTATSADMTQLSANLTSVVNNAQSFWGPSVTARLGGTFQSSFQAPLLAKYGITNNDPASLIALTPDKRAQFFVDWFDGLNGFTGFDQVDNWMMQANWSPHLSDVQGRGTGVTIGLVDTKLAGDADILSKVSYTGGSTAYSTVHGTAVASLLVSSHDGRNIMGIAPGAKLASYNPYDATAAATWKTVATGINAVALKGASVINLSLGEPGVAFSPKWDTAFNDAGESGKVVFVIAAGNDGLTQAKNIDWSQAKSVSFLVVGSVDANNVISAFSNKPGNACLRISGKCTANAEFGKGGALMNYFLVAPGENVLASDGKGGVARYSGTSLAAPLVTGAIALLQSRWAWLKKFPLETAQIILKSAKDLGAPGVDPVYGWGLLDVQASQAPLNFNNLTYYTVKNGVSVAQSVTAVRSSTDRAAWAADGAYISAFEIIGKTSRDFILPISPNLVGTKVGTVYFQDFVYDRLVSWANTPALTNVGGHLALSDTGTEAALPVGWGFRMSMRSRLAPVGPGERAARNFRTDNSVTVGDVRGRFSVTIGQGTNALNGQQSGFGLESDYAPLDGGVNPILGFASGGAHVRASMAIKPDLRITFGSSQTREQRGGSSAVALGEIVTANRYGAAATNIQMDYNPRKWLSLSASYTALTEANGLLGVRSNSAEGLVGASHTDAITLGASVEPGQDWLISASATRSNSRSKGSDAALRTSGSGLASSAFAVALAKSRLLGTSDQLRVSLAQPLAVSRGSLDLTTLAVVDRATGELGPVTQSLSVRERARLVGEVNYGLPLQHGFGEVSFFGRTDFRSDARNAQGVAAGARFKLAI